jgi:hypothetical protein
VTREVKARADDGDVPLDEIDRMLLEAFSRETAEHQRRSA